MRMRITIAAFAASALLLAGCATAAPTPAEGDAGSVGTLKIQTFPGGILSLAEVVGKEKGIYEAHGLDIQLVSVDTGPAATAALVSGAVDIMSNSPGNMLIPNSQGQDLVFLNNYISRDFAGWLIQKDWPTPNAGKAYPAPFKDWKGAKIGVSAAGSQVELQTRVLLQDAGLDPDRDVTFIAIGFGQQGFTAFAQKQVDIAVANEPMTSMIAGEGGGLLAYDDTIPEMTPEPFQHMPGNGRIATRTNAEAHPELFAAFNEAQKEVVEFMADVKNRDELIDIYVKFSGLEPKLAASVIDTFQPVWNIEFDCKALPVVIDFLNKNGILAEATTDVDDDCRSFMWKGSSQYAIGY